MDVIYCKNQHRPPHLIFNNNNNSKKEKKNTSKQQQQQKKNIMLTIPQILTATLILSAHFVKAVLKFEVWFILLDQR